MSGPVYHQRDCMAMSRDAPAANVPTERENTHQNLGRPLLPLADSSVATVLRLVTRAGTRGIGGSEDGRGRNL